MWLAFRKDENDGQLRVYLETGMPSFNHLEVNVNGVAKKISRHEYPAPRFEWPIRKGKNILEAQAVNVRGVMGKKVRVMVKNNN